jgi:hypothetical protein
LQLYDQYTQGKNISLPPPSDPFDILPSLEKHVEAGIKKAMLLEPSALVMAADLRYKMQRTTWGWSQSYWVWADRNLRKKPMYTPHSDWIDDLAKVLVLFGAELAYLPFLAVTVGSYMHPVSAAIALPLDAYNLYRYYLS